MGSSCSSVQILLILHCVLLTFGTNFVPIPDGILGTGGDETKSQGATWTVLITLDSPLLEAPLQQRLDTIADLLQN